MDRQSLCCSCSFLLLQPSFLSFVNTLLACCLGIRVFASVSSSFSSLLFSPPSPLSLSLLSPLSVYHVLFQCPSCRFACQEGKCQRQQKVCFGVFFRSLRLPSIFLASGTWFFSKPPGSITEKKSTDRWGVLFSTKTPHDRFSCSYQWQASLQKRVIGHPPASCVSVFLPLPVAA